MVTCFPTSMQLEKNFHFRFHQSLAGILTPIHGMTTCILHQTPNQISSRTEKVWGHSSPVIISCYHFEVFHLSAGKPKVRLTSDSPALNGSRVSFTAKLEYPLCQKEDLSGNLVWDDHCEDGMKFTNRTRQAMI